MSRDAMDDPSNAVVATITRESAAVFVAGLTERQDDPAVARPSHEIPLEGGAWSSPSRSDVVGEAASPPVADGARRAPPVREPGNGGRGTAVTRARLPVPAPRARSLDLLSSGLAALPVSALRSLSLEAASGRSRGTSGFASRTLLLAGLVDALHSADVDAVHSLVERALPLLPADVAASLRWALNRDGIEVVGARLERFSYVRHEPGADGAEVGAR